LDISIWCWPLISQAEIHEMVYSEDVDQRERAAALLGKNFRRLPDKEAAWKDLHGLTSDQDSIVRGRVADALGKSFQLLPDKDAAWKDLHELTGDQDSSVRGQAAYALGQAIQHLPDRDAAWKDLHRLTGDQNSDVRGWAAYALGQAIQHLPDRDAAWKDLHGLTGDQDCVVRFQAASALSQAFPHLPDKDAAWRDLHRLAGEKYSVVRGPMAGVLGGAFQHLPDKDAAWKDLHRLAGDKDSQVRWRAADALGEAFQHLPDKDAAWKDLHDMTGDKDSDVRSQAASALSEAFQHLPDKDAAWKDLHDLTGDQDCGVRSQAASALGRVFQHLQDRDAAWKDLHRLTGDQDSDVRSQAAGALGQAFQLLPDRDAAWKDLNRLTGDEDSRVRVWAAGAFGEAFQHLPDRDAAWKDLQRLTQDDDSGVRCTSYHSLGRASIFKAAEEEGEFKAHLEEAIDFFSTSSEEATDFNPSAFCLPFYSSLHSLLFTEVPREDEVQKYLAEAEEAIGASESRELLLEAVNNLSEALQEVRAYSIDDITFRKRDLKSYTKYCLKTAECLNEARAKAPLASKMVDFTLVEKSIPILDRKIKALFKVVESTAGKLCKSSKGTELEAFGKDACKSTRGLSNADSWISADRYLEDIVPLLKRHCNLLSPEAQGHLKALVESQDSADIERRYLTLMSVLMAALVQAENDSKRVRELERLQELCFKNIERSILNLNASSSNARKDLFDLKNQVDELQKLIETQGTGQNAADSAQAERDRAMIERLNEMRAEMQRSVRKIVQLNADKKDVDAILKKIEAQDKLKAIDKLGIIADISSLVGLALEILL
jgi:HEAT repeat protein